MLEIRKVKYEEFDELMEVMNASFNFKKNKDKFEHILPKLYFKDNDKMIHIGAFEDGKLVSSIGLYLMDFVREDKILHTACVGAVSTHPEHRNKGYFSKVITRILEEANNMNLDMLFLGGNRTRYGRYGFENCGRNIFFGLDRRMIYKLEDLPFEVIKLNRKNVKVTKKLYDMYNKQDIRIKRDFDEFYTILLSWNCTPYYVTYNGKIVGYFTLSEEEVHELIYNCKIDIMFRAILSLRNDVSIHMPFEKYDEIVDKCDWYTISENHMFNILNEEKVIDFLGGDVKMLDSIKQYDKLKRARLILGDCAKDSITGHNIYMNDTSAG